MIGRGWGAGEVDREGRRAAGWVAIGRVFAWVALVACVSGCDFVASKLYGPSNSVQEAANKLPVSDAAAVKDGTDLPSDVSGTDCGCLAKGMYFRFDTLQIKSLDGGQHLVMKTLNPLWQNDINNHELNFYLEIVDVAGDEFTLRIVNGARTNPAGDVCLLPVTESIVKAKRNGCVFSNTEPARLNVYAGTVANPKNCTTGLDVPHSIPVRKAQFEATLAPDCSAITQGTLVQGSIGKAALDNTCTCLTLGNSKAEDCGVPDPKFPGYASPKNKAGEPPAFCTECCKGCSTKYSNLKELLVSFGALKYTCTDEKDLPAVCLSATFTAPRIDKAPDKCP